MKLTGVPDLVRRLVVLAAIVILFTVLDYWWGIHSDAMSFAEGRVRESEAIRRRVGEVGNVRLELWGYSNRTGYAKDLSELRLRVTGTKGSIDLELRLEGKAGGRWAISSSNLPL